jgi:ABC-type branched-subunit amino acid transport system ATPase component
MTDLAAEPLLRTSAVSKRFGGFQALTDVSISVARGEIVALIGPNGAGKTTLFNVVSRIMAPTAGDVFFKGARITRTAPHLVARKGMARTFQDVRLFDSMTVWENIAVFAQDVRTATLRRGLLLPRQILASERRVRAKVEEVLEYLGLTAVAYVPSNRLSFAQQKKVAIGRCLARGAELLLLDEPASGLDGEEVDDLGRLVRRLAGEGVTVAFVEHNMDVVRLLATRAIFMAEGRVVAEAAPEELLRSAELAEVYFGSIPHHAVDRPDVGAPTAREVLR